MDEIQRPSFEWPTAGPLIIGLAGGSGSGKTTIAEKIVQEIGPEHVGLIQHDAYYGDLSHLPVEERAKVNYDHPDSLETTLLVEHLRELLAGRTIERPTYDFTVHNRAEETVVVTPTPICGWSGASVVTSRTEAAPLNLFASSTWTRCAPCTCALSSHPSGTPTSSFPRVTTSTPLPP